MTDAARIERILDRLENTNLSDKQRDTLERQLDLLRGEEPAQQE